MGWCSGTQIMDAAVEAADRAATAAWQLASDLEDARTSAFANALNADPTLRNKLDDVMRPFVAAIAVRLRTEDWDCIEEAHAFDRFRQEMLGYDHQRMTQWYRDRLYESDDPEDITKWSPALALHANTQGASDGR